MSVLKTLLVAMAGVAVVATQEDINFLACGLFATGDAGNLKNLAWDSEYGKNKPASSNPKPRTDKVKIAGKTCKRLFCWNTSGIYVCNQQQTAWDVAYADIGRWALYTIDHCCLRSQNMLEHSALSGQLTVDANRHISVGYANCNKGDDYPLAAYAGPGPNGWCT